MEGMILEWIRCVMQNYAFFLEKHWGNIIAIQTTMMVAIAVLADPFMEYFFPDEKGKDN